MVKRNNKAQIEAHFGQLKPDCEAEKLLARLRAIKVSRYVEWRERQLKATVKKITVSQDLDPKNKATGTVPKRRETQRLEQEAGDCEQGAGEGSAGTNSSADAVLLNNNTSYLGEMCFKSEAFGYFRKLLNLTLPLSILLALIRRCCLQMFSASLQV